MKTFEEFKAATGYEPVDDDLERANCTQTGKFGHAACGWCERCNKPRFSCGHFVLLSSANPITSQE